MELHLSCINPSIWEFSCTSVDFLSEVGFWQHHMVCLIMGNFFRLVYPVWRSAFQQFRMYTCHMSVHMSTYRLWNRSSWSRLGSVPWYMTKSSRVCMLEPFRHVICNDTSAKDELEFKFKHCIAAANYEIVNRCSQFCVFVTCHQQYYFQLSCFSLLIQLIPEEHYL